MRSRDTSLKRTAESRPSVPINKKSRQSDYRSDGTTCGRRGTKHGDVISLKVCFVVMKKLLMFAGTVLLVGCGGGGGSASGGPVIAPTCRIPSTTLGI